VSLIIYSYFHITRTDYRCILMLATLRFPMSDTCGGHWHSGTLCHVSMYLAVRGYRCIRFNYLRLSACHTYIYYRCIFMLAFFKGLLCRTLGTLSHVSM